MSEPDEDATPRSRPSVPDLADWAMRRKTIRNFADEEIPASELREIVAAGHAAPSLLEPGLRSFVWVRDPEKRGQIHDYCRRGQPQVEEASHFLLVCLDFRLVDRLLANRGRSAAPPSLGPCFVGAVDASVAAQAAMTAAESRGYGVCPIGSILANLADVASAVGLAGGVLPLFGLCIGIPHDSERSDDRPRIPLEAVLHEDAYREPSPELLDRCYENVDAMYEGSDRTWDGKIRNYWGPDGFMNRYEADVCEALAQQGFIDSNGLFDPRKR